MRRDEIIREVEVYTILFNPHIKKFEILANSSDEIQHINKSTNELMNSHIIM